MACVDIRAGRGVVPAAYLQYMNARPVESAKTSDVTVVSTAAAAVEGTLSNKPTDEGKKPSKGPSKVMLPEPSGQRAGKDT